MVDSSFRCMLLSSIGFCVVLSVAFCQVSVGIKCHVNYNKINKVATDTLGGELNASSDASDTSNRNVIKHN